MLPASIRFQKRLNQLHSEANLAIQREALSRGLEERIPVLGSTIDAWTSKLVRLENEFLTKLGRPDFKFGGISNSFKTISIC